MPFATEKFKARIYSDSYQYAISLFNRTKSFPKQFRPTLGRRLEERAIDQISIMRTATMSSKTWGSISKRSEYLLQASEYLDETRILLQLSHDLQILPDTGYSELSELTATIGKQLGGFIKAEQKLEK